ncbi:hypothetical protein CBR_g48125 [Chara braunii]|uniref:prolycopene isomerase n=1 Tax=Chara braunii TaxID=69332 RepID=A0A388M253_CHABU|nr:hypothetical protein CBR_g48125 [Chara braunii]|eukprot:GBG88595.1 hypothetical protein CBR_g48125 [Chara braunii]
MAAVLSRRAIGSCQVCDKIVHCAPSFKRAEQSAVRPSGQAVRTRASPRGCAVATPTSSSAYVSLRRLRERERSVRLSLTSSSSSSFSGAPLIWEDGGQLRSTEELSSSITAIPGAGGSSPKKKKTPRLPPPQGCRHSRGRAMTTTAMAAVTSPSSPKQTARDRASSVTGSEDAETEYDAIVIGSGMGGLVTATQLVSKGAKVLLLEKYIIPGGSSGFFSREGYTFDVGSSMMFGFGESGTTNLLTRSLAAVGKKLDVVSDPHQVHYHLPNGLSINVSTEYEEFISELSALFPHEREGIRKFYGECWKVFSSLNSLELKSLEEPFYLFKQFMKEPLACLKLAYYAPQNAGDVARKYIKDPTLLMFIDMECFIASTVCARHTPMINCGMVVCDRHHGRVRYPVGGVGKIPLALVEGFEEYGGRVLYKANVVEIETEGERAVGVRLSDGRRFRAKTVISNATRWDTFGKMFGGKELPQEEQDFQKLYRMTPSFLSIHMGVDASALPPELDVHHILLEDWSKLEACYGTIFVSIPSALDSSVAPPDRHVFHIFTQSYIDDWQGLSPSAYVAKKEAVADSLVQRLEQAVFPGLKAATRFREVGTPRTHRRYLGRVDGTYGPAPNRRPMGLIGMPFNTTAVEGLYCVGDTTFPGQGVNAVAFSGMACAHRVAADLGLEQSSPVLDKALNGLLSSFRKLALN